MKLCIQRVAYAKVEVDGQTIGQIERGLLALHGVGANDTEADLKWLADKMLNLRIFNDADGKMNLSVQDVGGGLLVVSQFTLFANCKKGNRPSFTDAAPPDFAAQMYDKLIDYLRQNSALRVETGRFGADMKVSLLNDGPVTLWLDTEDKFGPKNADNR